MTITLTTEETLAYQTFDADLTAFQSGVSATIEFLRRRKIETIVKSRPVPAEPKEGE